jgi:hypothetical protein
MVVLIELLLAILINWTVILPILIIIIIIISNSNNTCSNTNCNNITSNPPSIQAINLRSKASSITLADINNPCNSNNASLINHKNCNNIIPTSINSNNRSVNAGRLNKLMLVNNNHNSSITIVIDQEEYLLVR